MAAQSSLRDAGTEVLQHDLADRLVAQGWIRSAPVEKAFREVPRHLFVPDVPLREAYSDSAIKSGHRSCCSPPSLTAAYLEQLQTGAGDTVLEIGTALGYTAALLGRLVGPGGTVVSLELDAALAEAARHRVADVGNVHVMAADGEFGWRTCAPYDRIALTCASDHVSGQWVEQLAPNGRLQVPLVLSGALQKLVTLERHEDGSMRSVAISDCFFVPQWGHHDLWARTYPTDRHGSPGTHASRLNSPRSRQYGPASVSALGVRASVGQLWSGLVAWIALTDKDLMLAGVRDGATAGTLGSQIARGNFRASFGYDDGNGSAFLTSFGPAENSLLPLFVRWSGRTGSTLAGKLADQAKSWAAHGRPGNAQLAVEVRPAAFNDESRSRQFTVTWRYE